MNFLKNRNDQNIWRLGFGAWQLGNTKLWGEMTKSQAVELVQEAIKQGVVFFDTAPNYGFGLSEEIIGLAIKGKREQVFINTKFGHQADGTIDFSPHLIEKSIQESLLRLKTNYLDSVILHNPSVEVLKGETTHFQILKTLKEKGIIRYYGVSIDTKEDFKTVLESIHVDLIEILFNIFSQDVSQYFEQAYQKEIKLIAKVPLDSGWLSGKYNENTVFEGIRSRWSKQTIERRAELVQKLKSIVKSDTLINIAIAFILSFEQISVVIPGVKSIEQLNQNIEAANYNLNTETKQLLIEFYLKNIKNNPLPW